MLHWLEIFGAEVDEISQILKIYEICTQALTVLPRYQIFYSLSFHLSIFMLIFITSRGYPFTDHNRFVSGFFVFWIFDTETSKPMEKQYIKVSSVRL